MKSRIINLNKTSTRALTNLIPNGIDILEEITSDDNMYLTQSEDVDVIERMIGTKVMLGKGCSSSQWKEITKEEADAIRAELEKIIEEDRIKHMQKLNKEAE